eukprot:scaffold259022_cov34-Prasinocladus_malaysianus.AAC.1
MPYRAYPKGIYEAVAHCSQLGVPMYITGAHYLFLQLGQLGTDYVHIHKTSMREPINSKTGIADRDDKYREHHIKAYFEQIERCVRDGYDLRGVMYWTLVDNYEWDQGWTMHFGLYGFDPKTKVRKLKEGAKVIKEIFKEMPAKMRAARSNAHKKQPTDQLPAATDIPNMRKSA